MFIKLLIIFIFLPLAELFVLLKVGDQIGALSTILLIISTGVAGAWLARSQGFILFQRIQREMNEGRMPAEELLDGMMIFMGGMVLLTPGFITDLMGFTFLVPQTRNWIKRHLRKWLENRVSTGEIRFYRH